MKALSGKYPAYVRFPPIEGWGHDPDPYPAETQDYFAWQDLIDCNQQDYILAVASKRQRLQDLRGRQTDHPYCAVHGCVGDTWATPCGIPLCRRHEDLTRPPDRLPSFVESHIARVNEHVSLRWCPLRRDEVLPPYSPGHLLTVELARRELA